MSASFKIAATCPSKIIFQTLASGEHDYSECGSAAAAWEAEKTEAWVKTHIEEGEGTLESAKAEFMASLTEATPEEALQAAEDGYSWPSDLGFVEPLVAG